MLKTSLTIVVLISVLTRAEDSAFIASSLVIPSGTASMKPSVVVGVVARILSIPGPSDVARELLPSRPSFSTLVGPSAPKSAHLIAVAPASLGTETAAALATSKAARVALDVSEDFPGFVLSLRPAAVGSRFVGTDAGVSAAFPGATPASATQSGIADSAAVLARCSVPLEVAAGESGSFTLYGAAFAADEATWAAELAAICEASMSPPSARFVAVGARAAVAVAARYGEGSAQAVAFARATDHLVAGYISALPPRTEFVVISSARFSGADAPEAMAARNFAARAETLAGGLVPSDPHTATTQIIIWTTVVLFFIMLATFVVTFGVGVSAEKDTLLYRATTTYH